MAPANLTLEAPRKLMSVDEFWDFVNRPENAERLFELRRGEVVELSRPTKPHGIVCTRIGTRLQVYADRVSLGYVTSNDAGVVLASDPDTVVGPDVAYFTDANRFEDVHPKWGESVPLLAVEVLSPNDKLSEVNEKIEDYLSNGVKVVWLVDYEQRKVTVYRSEQSHTVLRVESELLGEPELPGFRCPVADLFRLPGDKPAPVPPT